MAKRPNLLLIMVDEMRGDCMSLAGHPDVKTPYLDSLASRGIWFPNAYSSCPTCVPARAVLHTGLSQRHTGRVGYQDGVAWNYGRTMAGELAKAGYYTQCVGKMHVHPLRETLGFHNVELHDGYLHEYRYPNVPYGENQLVADDYFYWLKTEKGIDCDVTDTGIDCNSWVARPWPYEEKYHPTNWVASRSIDFLRRRDPRRPFFLMTSFVRPHAPYDAPQHYFDLYERKELRPPLQGDWDDRALREELGGRYNAPTGPKDAELIRQQQAGYYACITHVDHQIGRLIMALVEQRLMEDTVILFASDHGEMLSDHCFSQKSRPYQGSVRIPMIISGAERWIGAQNRTNDALVELRDVMPTLLSLAQAEISTELDGSSMLAPSERETLHCEHVYEFGQKSFQMMLTKTDKYIWFSQTGQEQYFDLANDPTESHDGIADEKYQSRVSQLRQELIRVLAGCEEGYSDGTRLIAGHAPRILLRSVLGQDAQADE
ncbi:MAG: arylsulfatase [Clostridia bacterium]